MLGTELEIAINSVLDELPQRDAIISFEENCDAPLLEPIASILRLNEYLTDDEFRIAHGFVDYSKCKKTGKWLEPLGIPIRFNSRRRIRMGKTKLLRQLAKDNRKLKRSICESLKRKRGSPIYITKGIEKMTSELNALFQKEVEKLWTIGESTGNYETRNDLYGELDEQARLLAAPMKRFMVIREIINWRLLIDLARVPHFKPYPHIYSLSDIKKMIQRGNRKIAIPA